MSQEQIQIDYPKENLALYQELTKRNQQYMYDFDKALQAANVSTAKRHEIKYDMMITLVKAQKKGLTARQLYGTVAQQVATVLNGPQEDLSKPSPDWQLFIDGGLMLGSAFMILSGLTAQNRLGILSLLLNFLFAGMAMLVVTKASPKYIGTTNVRNKKFLTRYIGATILGMLIWMVGIMVLPLVPEAINPVLDGMIYIIIGLGALVLRFYLKRLWNIRGTMF